MIVSLGRDGFLLTKFSSSDQLWPGSVCFTSVTGVVDLEVNPFSHSECSVLSRTLPLVRVILLFLSGAREKLNNVRRD